MDRPIRSAGYRGKSIRGRLQQRVQAWRRSIASARPPSVRRHGSGGGAPLAGLITVAPASQSLYLDTPERAMIARSVEKPLYKEKLRLRAYGDAAGVALMGAFSVPGRLCVSQAACRFPAWEVECAGGCARVARTAAGAALAPRLQTMGFAGSGVQAALERRFGQRFASRSIVYKRRLALGCCRRRWLVSGLPYEQACARWPLPDAGLRPWRLSPATRQIAREPEAAMNRWLPLVPSSPADRVAWAYRPEALEEREDDNCSIAELRITFDDCLGVSRPSLLPFAMAAHHRVERVRHEIKSAPYPPWLVDVLSAERHLAPGFIYQVWQRLSDGNGCAARSKSSEGLCVVVREPFGKCESWK